MKVEVHSQFDIPNDDTFTSVLIKFSASEVTKACNEEPGLMAILQAKPQSPSDLLEKFNLLAQVLERMGTTSSTANSNVDMQKMVRAQVARFQQDSGYEPGTGVAGWVDSQRGGA